MIGSNLRASFTMFVMPTLMGLVRLRGGGLVLLRDVGLVGPFGERCIDDELAQLRIGVLHPLLRFGDERVVALGLRLLEHRRAFAPSRQHAAAGAAFVLLLRRAFEVARREHRDERERANHWSIPGSGVPSSIASGAAFSSPGTWTP